MTNETPKSKWNTESRVLATILFYKRDKDGAARFNDDTGARFWSRNYGDGCVGLVAQIDEAQNVTKLGKDISNKLCGNRVTLRVDRQDFEELRDETRDYEGIGVQVILNLTREVHISRLNITNSLREGGNGVQTSITAWGDLVDYELAQATLTETGVDGTIEDFEAALDEGRQQVKAQAEQARNNRQVEMTKASAEELTKEQSTAAV